jgi:MSHA biogenesis protein MshJ
MQIIDALNLKPWMARFDGLSLPQRVVLVAATALMLYFILSLVLLGQTQSASKGHRQRIDAQQAELAAVRRDIRELSAALEHDPNAQKQAELDGIKRVIDETDALLAQLDAVGPQSTVLRELLIATPGLELVSLKTVPVTLAFQSKAAPVSPAKPVPAAAAPAPAAKDVAPNREIVPRPPRSIYQHGIEISIKGNYLALLPYLEKLQKYPGHLYWTDASLDVQSYPLAVLKLTVYSLSGQATPRLG